MPQDELEKRLRDVEAAVVRSNTLIEALNGNLELILGYESRIRSLENFRSKVLGYSAGVVGLGAIVLYLVDKITK